MKPTHSVESAAIILNGRPLPVSRMSYSGSDPAAWRPPTPEEQDGTVLIERLTAMALGVRACRSCGRYPCRCAL